MRVVFLVVLLVAQSATARPSKEVTRAFQAGVDAFRLGEYDVARSHLERARQLDPKLPGPNRFLAAVAQAQGRFADCIAAARSAIELNPASAEIADTRRLHDDCRRSAGRAVYSAELGNKAAIGITANVTGATVTIDGLVYGATPLEPRPITAGPHEVALAKPGYRSVTVTVNALAGLVTDLEIEMEVDPATPGLADGTTKVTARDPGWLELTGAPTDAAVVVDGKPVAPRAGVYSLAPGPHVVEVTARGKDVWRRRVMIARAEGLTIAPDLVDTASREGIRRLGAPLVLTGVGLAAIGGVAVYQTTRDDGFVWKGLAGTAIGLSAVTLGVGVWALVRGQRPDLSAPPPFAVIPVEAGVITTTGFDF